MLCRRWARPGPHLERLLGLACTHFYDDYAVVEPSALARHGQAALGVLHTLVGFPFAEKKHVAAAALFVFLGVEATCRPSMRLGSAA